MYKSSELIKNVYRPKEISKMLCVTTKTLRNWEERGKISYKRDPKSNRRYMTRGQVIELLKEHRLFIDDTDANKRDVIYARVSSHEQKAKGDLDRQVQFLIDSCDNLQNVLVLSEVGSGLNDKRRNLLKLIEMVMNDEVKRVFVTYKDRLTRFGFNYLRTIFEHRGVEIVVYNKKDDMQTVNEELVEDMISLIASFSGKLYGLQSRKNGNEV